MRKSPWRGVSVILLAMTVGACSRSAPAPAPPPPEVAVTQAKPTDIPLTRTYPGRLAATLIAQVRARVTGVILQRVYTEGTDVKPGAVLFKIDPAPFEATLRAAEGTLAQAQATARNAERTAARSRKLGTRGGMSEQEVDNAVAAAAEAEAAVKTAKANVVNARIDLGYATVTAPISGRAGRANVTQGALVSPTDSEPLTTVQEIDPIYANFSEPVAEVTQLRAAARSGELELVAPGKAVVRITLPDGHVYPHAGTLDFRDTAVDPATGAVDMRALVPNPDHVLLPGMFTEIRLTLGTLHNAFLLPQSAIQRDSDGAYVYVVGADDKIVEKRVDLGNQHGADWIVRDGINAGARVVVAGIQKVQPGAKVKTVPYHAAGGGAPTAGATD